MNNLTKIAALPTGGGCQSALRPEDRGAERKMRTAGAPQPLVPIMVALSVAKAPSMERMQKAIAELGRVMRKGSKELAAVNPQPMNFVNTFTIGYDMATVEAARQAVDESLRRAAIARQGRRFGEGTC